MITGQSLDAVIISSYGFMDTLHLTTEGAFVGFELHLDNQLADFDFLRSYFRNNRDLELTRSQWDARPPKDKMPTYLSGVYLSSFLRKQMNLNVRTINSFVHEQDRLDEYLKQSPPFVIVSTTLIVMSDHLEKITRYVRERSPETKIILGGLKLYKSYKIKQSSDNGEIPDFSRESLAKYHYFMGPKTDEADYYIINTRGEHTLLRLLKALGNGEDVSGMENLAYYTEAGTWQINPVVDEPNYLKDWCIDWESVEEEIIGGEFPVSFKQGCPYSCSFCEFTALDRDLSARSLDLVIDEIKRAKDRFDLKNIYFVDENLFFNKKQLREFCERLDKEQLGLRWRAQTRVTYLDPDTSAMLKESGCFQLALGIESGDDTVLKNMNKKSTAEQNYIAVCDAQRAGIDVYATFVVGFPGETEETFQNTVDMIKRFPTDNGGFVFYHAFPFLLTPLCPASTQDFRKTHGLTGGQNRWQHPTMTFGQATDLVLDMFLTVDNASHRYLNSTEATTLRNNIPQHRTILQARQKLAQGRVRGASESEEAPLWDVMEQAYQELEDRN